MVARVSPPKDTQRLNLRSYLVLFVCFLLLLPVAGEALVRNFPSLLPEAGQIRMQAVMMKDEVMPDKEIGFVRRPGLRQRVDTMDFSYLRETDSSGFPNRDPWPSRADLVVLGDSLVMGEGTGLDRSFVGRFQQANPKVKVINLGIAGAGPDRQLLAYRKYGAPLQPKAVLAFLFLAADITNSEQFQRWRKQAPETDYNRFRLDLGRNKQPGTWLNRSRLVTVIKSKIAAGPVKAQAATSADASTVFLDQAALEYLNRGVNESSEQMRLLMNPLAALRDAVEAHGAQFYAVLMPSKEEVFTRSYSVVNTVRSALDRAGIEYLDLYEVIAQKAAVRSPYFCRDIHLNEYGNQMVADFLDNWWHSRIGD
ncbi:MAG: hypothetical protein EHM61_00870 [Acidobacteria bacterium]|nr:MAG: hypothetical protein EHM61_00870 [Acidobacteriota bacterium]